MQKTKLIFPLSWWKLINRLNLDEQKEVVLNLIKYIFEQDTPTIMSENAAAVWSLIMNKIEVTQKKNPYRNRRQNHTSENFAQCGTSEKEQNKEKEETSPTTSKEQKENKKEKDPSSRAFSGAFALHYPHLGKMSCPLELSEYQRVLLQHPFSLIKRTLSQMERYPDIEKRYTSCYRTLLNWLEREEKGIKQDGRWAQFERELEAQKK